MRRALIVTAVVALAAAGVSALPAQTDLAAQQGQLKAANKAAKTASPLTSSANGQLVLPMRKS